MHRFQPALAAIKNPKASDSSLAFVPLKDSLLSDALVIYASTRATELAQTGWPQAMQDQFIQQQFEAQHQHYQNHYQPAEYLLIQDSGNTIGRIYIQDKARSICLIDIALLPEWQNMGLGQAMLREILMRAQTDNKSVNLHVERHNPAFLWYLKLGFEAIEDRGVYQYLEWHPKAQQ